MRGMATHPELSRYVHPGNLDGPSSAISVVKTAFDMSASSVRSGAHLRCSHTLTETTGFIGDVYANPSRSLYKALGLVENLQKTPAGQNKRSYLTKGLLSNIFQSIMVSIGSCNIPGCAG